MASSSRGKYFAFYTTATWRRKVVAWSMLFFYLTQPVLASAEVIADPKAPNNTPIVQPAANGLPIVQIAAPTVGGVSHNLYQKFNVDPSGLILNNSRVVTQTQLAGYITGNPNLANGPARIILNEVTSNNPSYLRGYTEVAGQKAEVIIANPNGIYGDGFGFINTSRAVLTTGTPVFGGSGSLEAFRVNGGQVSIQGAGMNASDVDQVDLISRSVAVNAGVWAKNLNVVTGSNTVDHNTLKADPIAGDANTIPQVAIDIGQLGGMYANKIYLVGTEKGVGVNSSGTIAAQAGDVTITSAGKVLLAGNTSATGNIQVAAEGDVTNQRTLYAQGNTSITTQGALENSGTLVAGGNTTLSAQHITSTGTLGAGVKTNGTLGNAGDLTLNASGTIRAQGQNMAAGNLTVNGAAIDLVNSQNYVGGNASITTTMGDIDHSNGTMQVAGALSLNAQGMIRNDNGTINAEQLTLSGEAISNRSGTLSQLGQGATTITAVKKLDNTAGTISTNGESLTIQGDSLLNSQGQIQHAGTGILSVQTTGDINNNTGKLATNGQLHLTTHSIDNTQGTIIAKGIDLNAQGTLGNDHGTIASSGDAIRMNVQGALSNEQGSIEANNGLELTAQSIDNQKGSLVSLDTSGLKITASQDIQNQSGTIGGNGDINLAAQSLLNSSGNVIAQGNINGDLSQTIDNSNGNIKAQQSVTLGQLNTNISNTMQGTISAGNNLDLKANTFDNTNGNLVAKQDIGIQAEDMKADGTALAGQDVNLTIKNRFTQNVGGDLKANRDVNIVADTFLNQGSIAAVGDINLTVNEAANDNGSKLVGNKNLNITATGDVANSGIMAGSTATMDAKNITNRGSILADQLTVDANMLSNIGNTAVITANQTSALHLDTALHNTNGATMYMKNKDTAFTVNTLSFDNSGVIISGGGLTVEAQTIQSSGTLGAGVQSDGTLGTDGDLLLQASGNVLATGKNLAAGTIAITAKDISLTGAKTGAGKDISLTATTGNITNTGGVIQAKEAITLQAAKAVHNDKDAAGNAANLQGNVIAIHANTISNVGSSMIQFGSKDTNLTAATTLDNTGGSIVTNGTNLMITADTVTGNQSKIIHAGTGTLELTAATRMSNTNGSSIQSNGDVTVEAGDLDNTKGSITALQGIEVAGNTLTNSQGTIAASKEVSITLQNGLNNQKGIVEAGKALAIQAQAINNKEGSISSLDASGMTVSAAQSIDNTAGTIGSNGDVSLTAQSVVNSTGKILSQGNINADISQSITNTNGTIAARQNVTIGKTGTNILNGTHGSITAGGTLVAQANTLSNTGGTMAANGDVTLTAAAVSGTGTVTAGQDVNLTTNSDFTYSADSNVKANRDINLTAANVNNLGTMAAVRNLTIHTNNIMNNAGASLQGGSGLTISSTGSISNAGTIEGNTTNLNAQNITNTGSVFGDAITMEADTVANNGNTAVIAATKNVSLYAKTSLENKDDAMIYSMGDINIAGSNKQNDNGKYTERTGSVFNQSATIEADNDIQIYADDITNKKREFVTGQTVVSQLNYGTPGQLISTGSRRLNYWSGAQSTSVLVPYGIYLKQKTISETNILKDSPEGKILSGRNMILDAGTINNNLSSILAAVFLHANADASINNISVGRTRSTTNLFHEYTDKNIWVTLDYWENEMITNPVTGVEHYTLIHKTRSEFAWFKFDNNLPSSTTTESIEAYTSRFGGGKEVNIQTRNINNMSVIPDNLVVDTVNHLTTSGKDQGIIPVVTDSNTNNQTINMQAKTDNISVNSSNVPINMQTLLPTTPKSEVIAVQHNLKNITLPTNSLFTIHKEPSSKYLVETNPRFANYEKFISSDYMLQQLGLDPARNIKLLGDGFYEQKLVRDQVTELTGRYYLTDYSSAEEQFKALMDNGATYAKQFNLQVGVALTSEQMAQLTSNMVWMVEKEVEGQKVLVPEVYLSRSGNIELKANGAVIAADNVKIVASGDVDNAGVIKATESVQVHAVDIANYGGIISANKSIDLTADRDISVIATQVNAGQDITINAGRNLTVDSVQQQEQVSIRGSDWSYLKKNINNVVSTINAGNNINISSTGDTILKGAQVSAGNFLDLTAGGNIHISTVKDETIQDQTVGISHGTKRTRTDDETVIGTSLQGENKVKITSGHLTGDIDANPNGGNINIEGSHIASDNGKVEITADKDITIQDVTEKHDSLVVTHKKKSGFLSSKTTDTMDHSLINEVVGSTISGDQVSISSGNDLTIKGSNVVGTEEVSLSAKEDVNILSAAETGASDHYSYTKKSGLLGGGGLGFTIGSQSKKTTTNEQTLGEVGSTIGSIDGNVSITAGKKVDSEGTTFVSGKDLSITGKEVTIDNTIDTYDSKTKYEFKQTGLSVSLGGGIVNTATSAYNNIKRSGQVEDERLKALYDYKAFKDLDKINDQLDNGMSKENLKKGVSVSVSIGSSKMTSEETVHTETVNTSNMNAGGDVTIKATEGDVNLKGTNINAENVTLDAAKNVNIGAAENKQQTTTNTSSSSWSVGGTIGSGFFGNVSKGSGKENENATTNTGSIIDANDTLKIKSGADTNIIGSQVKGDTVVANVDGNLNIVSKQDTDDYTSKNQSSGFGISTGPKGGITGSVSKGKTDSTYASVTEQAGIHAGEGGFDIEVGKNTDLKGAVIASDATPDKNELSTDTLTYSDIENTAEYSASSVGVNLDTRKGTEKKDAGLTPNIGGTASGDADSTTKSAVSPGTIEVRSNPNQDLSNLSRDTNNSLNVLGKIFDKKTVQEQQELADLFGKEVFKAVGDLKLKEGSSEKAAIDFFVGGLMAKLGGGDFLSGAASGGITQLVMKDLAKIKDPALLQWASAVVGAASAKVIGGNAQTGASVAASETKNNFLTHEQYAKYQAQLKELKEKLKDGSITQEEYNVAVNEVTNYWADKDKKQNKQWLADNHIEAVVIDFGSAQIALEKQQYQQMLIELSNSKNDEETAAIKEKWSRISNEQIDKWVKMGEDLGYNMDGSKTSLFPDLSTEVVNINNPYTAWLVKSETENSLFWAERSLQAQGIDPNDPGNAQLLATEVEKQLGLNKEIQESIASSIGGGSFKTFKELKAFLGSPGAENQWHHIVEQAQKNASRAGFAVEEINSVENIIALQSGKGSVHSKISGLYSSKPYWTDGLTVRDWLATKSFAEQFEFGMNALKDYGKVTRDSVGKWIFTPFE